MRDVFVGGALIWSRFGAEFHCRRMPRLPVAFCMAVRFVNSFPNADALFQIKALFPK